MKWDHEWLGEYQPVWQDESFRVRRATVEPLAKIRIDQFLEGTICYPNEHDVLHTIKNQKIIVGPAKIGAICWVPGHGGVIENLRDTPLEALLVEIRKSQASAVINPQLFTSEWPDAFQKAVNDDALAIGLLGTIAATGRVPSEADIVRAALAKEDLEWKSLWHQNFVRAQKARGFVVTPAVLSSAPYVKVTVHTKDQNGKDIAGLEVWYVARAWEGVADYEERFDRLSTPTTQEMVVGHYALWTHHNGQKGSSLTVRVGENLEKKRTIDLVVGS
jgi:hypothetical protein